jgi:outer membrane biogenesis lipoprotein LolB
MTRRLFALLLALALLTGCDDPQRPRTIDCWQSAVDQGWVQP